MKTAGKQNLWYYNAKLKSFARENRKEMTKAEACIWKYLLSNRKMMGYQFRRQRPILNYIADFLCKELMLIIEVDGLTHQWEEVSKKDVIRERDLKQIGFEVLRFHDEEVLNDIVNVERAIVAYIEDYRN
jgi:very-short-patch-repair endonuclease